MLRPGSDQWDYFRLDATLPSGVRLGLSYTMVDVQNNGTRLLVCGGWDAIRQIQESCYYL